MRKRRRNKHLPLKIVFLVAFFLSAVGVGYSYFSSILKISGNVTGQVNNESYTLMTGSDPSMSMKIYKMSTITSGGVYNYQYVFDVTNNGTSTINSFRITANFNNNVKSIAISNYDSSISGKTVTITNNTYRIESGKSLRITLTVSSIYANLMVSTVKLEQIAGPVEIDPTTFPVVFVITNSSGQYTYDYNVTLTNKTGTRTNTWQLDIPLPEGTTFISGLDGVYSYSNGILTIKNSKSNGKINNTASITITMKLSTNIINFIPTNVKVTLS